jgi:hypothetical protein
MSQRELITQILKENDIDPEKLIGGQTSFEILERWVEHALEKIEESDEDDGDEEDGE